VGTHEGATEESIARGHTVLAELQQEGRIRHLGLSGTSSAQLTEAQSIAHVVAVQNLYNLVYRGGDSLVERTAREHIAFVSYFPLGGLGLCSPMS
jgi:aryl-alcohol dehydrogenase-like predicted oxidoreductase